MATVYRTNINTYEGMMTFLTGLNNPLITSDTRSGDVVTIVIDNIVTLAFSKYSGNNIMLTPTVTYNGTTTTLTRIYVQRSQYYNQITFGSSNTLFYLQLQMKIGSTQEQGFAFIYHVIDGKYYFGYWAGGTSSFYNISNFSLIAADANTYNYGIVIPYTVPTGTLHYSNSDILFLSGTKAALDSEFKACSTVTSNSIITFNANNYFSIGTNTLLPIDN